MSIIVTLLDKLRIARGIKVITHYAYSEDTIRNTYSWRDTIRDGVMAPSHKYKMKANGHTDDLNVKWKSHSPIENRYLIDYLPFEFLGSVLVNFLLVVGSFIFLSAVAFLSVVSVIWLANLIGGAGAIFIIMCGLLGLLLTFMRFGH